MFNLKLIIFFIVVVSILLSLYKIINIFINYKHNTPSPPALLSPPGPDLHNKFNMYFNNVPSPNNKKLTTRLQYNKNKIKKNCYPSNSNNNLSCPDNLLNLNFPNYYKMNVTSSKQNCIQYSNGGCRDRIELETIYDNYLTPEEIYKYKFEGIFEISKWTQTKQTKTSLPAIVIFQIWTVGKGTTEIYWINDIRNYTQSKRKLCCKNKSNICEINHNNCSISNYKGGNNQGIYIKTQTGYEVISIPLSLSVNNKWSLNINFNSSNMIVNIKDSNNYNYTILCPLPIPNIYLGKKLCYFKSGLYSQLDSNEYSGINLELKIYKQSLILNN